MRRTFLFVMALILTACSSQAKAVALPTVSMQPGPLHNSGQVVAETTNEYAERDITSPVLRALQYHDVFIVIACTWVMQNEFSPGQVWLKTEKGYVLALDKSTETYNAIYELDAKCERVSQ